MIFAGRAFSLRHSQNAADSRHGFASMVQSKSCREVECSPRDGILIPDLGRVAQLAEQLTLNQ
jgi:hypothetical protein